ncbi:MAG: energy-coupling factor transporter transmembrane protein EcfT, partial [Clostridiales bacterium]|nr:energy-coupling factor transporter transmembrane protein EcfT [Clostridiales bacterium]
MIKDITIGQYFPGSSFIHLLDPRIKIVISFIFIILIFFVKSFLGYAFVFLFLATVVAVSGIPPKYVIKGLKPLIFIIVLTFFLNIFFTSGETVLWKAGFLVLTKEGIIQGIFMALRLMFLVSGTSLLTLTTSPISLTDGIVSLLRPLSVVKFPAHELAM